MRVLAVHLLHAACGCVKEGGALLRCVLCVLRWVR